MIRDDLPGSNGITVYRGRPFVDECRVGGRLVELPMPNAMEVGPTGCSTTGHGDQRHLADRPDGGEPEWVVGDLGVPDSVEFDSAGFITSTKVQTGEVLRTDPRDGDRQVPARLAPGLDNCTFVGDRLFVSSFTGEIIEILPGGDTRAVPEGDPMWPLDLTVEHDGTVHLADGAYFYALRDGRSQTLALLFSAGTPAIYAASTASARRIPLHHLHRADLLRSPWVRRGNRGRGRRVRSTPRCGGARGPDDRDRRARRRSGAVRPDRGRGLRARRSDGRGIRSGRNRPGFRVRCRADRLVRRQRSGHRGGRTGGSAGNPGA